MASNVQLEHEIDQATFWCEKNHIVPSDIDELAYDCIDRRLDKGIDQCREVAYRSATNINNAGLDVQVSFLISNGIRLDQLIIHVQR